MISRVFLSMALILSTRACVQDEVLGVDCRGFSDPQQHKDKASGRLPGNENHIGYHHIVFAGFLPGVALVYNQRARKREQVSLTDWWEQFVLQLYWNKMLHFQEKLKAWGKHRDSDNGVKPRLFVVLFCKWGRRRSVAMQNCSNSIYQHLKWARLAEALHLSSHSWKWVTCNCCQVLVVSLFPQA